MKCMPSSEGLKSRMKVSFKKIREYKSSATTSSNSTRSSMECLAHQPLHDSPRLAGYYWRGLWGHGVSTKRPVMWETKKLRVEQIRPGEKPNKGALDSSKCNGRPCWFAITYTVTWGIYSRSWSSEWCGSKCQALGCTNWVTSILRFHSVVDQKSAWSIAWSIILLASIRHSTRL